MHGGCGPGVYSMKHESLYVALFTMMLMAATAGAQDGSDHAFEPAPPNTRIEADAKGGDPTAQAALGRLYLYAGATARNLEAAMYWFERAAEQGEPEGQYHVAYAFGEGQANHEHNWSKAFQLYEQAAGASHAASQFALGFLYYVGKGTDQDFVEAAKWYRKAAQQGLPSAQFNLAGLFFDGTGVQKDLVQSYMWFLIARHQVAVPKIEDEYVMHGVNFRGADLASAAQRNLTTLDYMMTDEERAQAMAMAEETVARWELVPGE